MLKPVNYYIISTLVFIFVSVQTGKAQTYMKEKSRHRFAQTYIGFNSFLHNGGGNIEGSEIPAIAVPRFTIGGYHFWGHVDFSVNFPLSSSWQPLNNGSQRDVRFNAGGDLAMRIYPWAIKNQSLRPYAGITVNASTFSVRNQPDQTDRHEAFFLTGLQTGFTFPSNFGHIHAGVQYIPSNERSFWLKDDQASRVAFPDLFLSVGLRGTFDGTLRNEKPMRSGETKRREDRYREYGWLNSFTLMVAPSGGHFLLAPANQDVERASLPRHRGVFVMEYGLGYQWHDADIHAGIYWRDYTSSSDSYSREQLIRRRALSFEVIRFLKNRGGFKPFIGPSISLERWAMGEFIGSDQQGPTLRTKNIHLGIIAGWDIVASPLETWILRTNLRWYPGQQIETFEGKQRVDQFEFNFIQLVLFPQRIVRFKR